MSVSLEKIIDRSIDHGLATSHFTQTYHPTFVEAFNQKFSDRRIRVEYAEHDNGMPLYLVGSSIKTMMLLWVNGDNYRNAMAEIDLVGSALTVNPDAAGANTEELIVMFPFADFRGHKRTRKEMPESTQTAIVQAEGVTNITLVRKLKHVAQAQAVVAVDIHNLWETGQQFAQEKLELVNLTTNQLLVEYLLRNNLLTDDLETVVASTDIGNLPNAYDLSIKLSRALGHTDPLPLIIHLKSKLGPELDQKQVNNRVKIKGKRVIISEDMISSGGTTEETVTNLFEDDTEEVIFYATHAVFVKDYYERLTGLLSNPKVKIIISDSLPFIRKGKSVAIPYARTKDGAINKIHVINIGDWLAEKAEIILQAENIAIARELLKDEIIDPINPYQLLTRLTGQELSPPKDTAVYLEGGTLQSLPSSATLFTG